MAYSTEGARAIVLLLSIATALTALGVSAALGSISFSLKGRAAPKGLARRAEVLLLVVSLVVPVLLLPVLWSAMAGFVEGTGSPGAYLLGAVLPSNALALALLDRPGTGFGSSVTRGKAFVLAVLSCGLYASPVFLYGYAFWGA